MKKGSRLPDPGRRELFYEDHTEYGPDGVSSNGGGVG